MVAGAFTIDSIGGSYIERIEGDYHTVVGLSLVALRNLMAELGYNYQDFWR
jgi:septum formation protein